MSKFKIKKSEFNALVESVTKRVISEDFNQVPNEMGRISIDELIELADAAREMVPDAGDALMELGEMSSGDYIPTAKIERVLMNYDITLDELRDYNNDDGLAPGYDQENDEFDTEPESLDYPFESKKPSIKLKISELRNIVAQVIKEDNLSMDENNPHFIIGELQQTIRGMLKSLKTTVAMIESGQANEVKILGRLNGLISITSDMAKFNIGEDKDSDWTDKAIADYDDQQSNKYTRTDDDVETGAVTERVKSRRK